MLTSLATLCLFAAAAASAAASVTMSTQAATKVAGTSAQLIGDAAGAGSGDYCSFIFWTTSSSSYTTYYPATHCGSPYEVNIAHDNTLPLQNDTTYHYAAIHCADPVVVQGQGETCQTPSGSTAPWDAIDSCYSTPSSCPSFETGSGSGITGAPPNNLPLATTSPTQVSAVSAFLQGTSGGYVAGSNGSGDYCSFLLWQGNAKSGATVQTPAVSCTARYSLQVTGLTPGTTYAYAAVHCAAVSGQPNGPYYCDTTGAFSDTNVYDYADPCFFDANSNCTEFTTLTPSAVASPAGDVLGTSATLSGQILTEGEPAGNISWWFEYSTDAGFAAYAQTPVMALNCPSPSGSDGACQVSASIGGLQQGTTYYFRLVAAVADSPAGNATSSAQSFTTGGRALTDPATSVTASSATLNGELAPGDSALSYNWAYSTADTVNSSGDLEGQSACAQSCGTVAAGADQLVSQQISGLAGATTYYFQLQTANPALHGQVLTLTTANPSCTYGGNYGTQGVTGTTFVVSGCWSSANGVWTGYGPVRINGLSLPGPASSTVTINTSKRTLSLSGGFQVALGRLLLVNASGTLTFSYSTDGNGDSVLALVPDPSASWFGFPLLGDVTVTAYGQQAKNGPQGGSTISIQALGVPALFGGITATGSGSVSADGSLSNITVQIGQSTLGPLTLPSFQFSYDEPSNTWSGNLQLYIPMIPDGIGASVTVQNDRLNAISLSAAWSPGIPLGDGAELSSLGGQVSFSPFSFGGQVGIGFGPEFRGVRLFVGTVGFLAAFNQDQTITGNPGIPDGYTLPDVPLTITVNGQLQLLGFITLGQGAASFYDLPGSALITANVGLPPSLAVSCPSWLGGGQFGISPSFNVAGDAYIDYGNLAGSDFNLVGAGTLTADLCGLGDYGGGGDAVISNVGFAVCFELDGNADGLGGTWPTTLPRSLSDLLAHFHLYLEGGCDIGPYEAEIKLSESAAIAAAAGSGPQRLTTFRLPRGLPFAVVKVAGRAQAPVLALDGPRGLRVVMNGLNHLTVARDRYLVTPDPLDDTTYIELTRPPAGRYLLSVLPGSAPVLSVALAHGQPAPTVRATVTGRGFVRVLSWRAVNLAGRRILFRDLGGTGDRLLLSTTRARGALRFRVRPGLGAKRFIEAEVIASGIPVRIQRVASYRGPVLGLPARPARLHARRRRTMLQASWRDRGASRYLVFVALPDRIRRLYMTRAPRLTLRSIPARGEITVTVTAVNVLGQRGRSARIRVR
ncbi:MAG TPA: hypothetical protein VKV27_14365 [Solirubrobacteraceae bacterium]|nr:hypothetical protein [Solirubrobacteraceae bacterium]